MDIRIVPLEEAHHCALGEIMIQPGVCWGTLGHPLQSPERHRQMLQKRSEEATDLVALAEGEVAGYALLNTYSARRKHAGYLIMAVADVHTGKGMGSALLAALIETADNWLDLRRLELNVFVDNLPAIALYEKFGFVPEGLQHHFAYRDGKLVDALAMARSR